MFAANKASINQEDPQNKANRSRNGEAITSVGFRSQNNNSPNQFSGLSKQGKISQKVGPADPSAQS